MTFSADIFDFAGLRLDDLFLTPTTVVVSLVATNPAAACPCCGTSSERIHSRYRRTVADLAWRDRLVALRLLVRKFRCCQPDCPRSLFCERLPRVLEPWARATAGLTKAQRDIGFALGGEAGARLTAQLFMPTSPDTLLRRVKEASVESDAPPRYVGVDDWALRKGQRYGTILVDLERGRVIDLLPGRDGTALEAWLKEHPGVEIISRDRWPAYAQAATAGAPQAEQVADRWHLLKNLREAIEKLLDRLYSKVKPVLQETPLATATDAVEAIPAPPAHPTESPPDTVAVEAMRQPARLAKRQRRIERYEQVRQLHKQRVPLRQIARQLRISRKTIQRYVQGNGCPDWKPGQQRPTRLKAYTELVDRRIAEGCRNAAQMQRELAAAGCSASTAAVLRFFNRRLATAGHQRQRANAASVVPTPPPSARKLSFEFIRRPENRKPAEQERLERIRGVNAEITEALKLADEFVGMVRQRLGEGLADWLTKAAEAAAQEVRGFAGGIRQDEAAVKAGLTQPWSNGPVEGQVNRLKVIKRTMYGRAGLDLLRARVVHAS